MKKFKIGGVPEHFNLPWRKTIEEGRLDQLDVTLHWSDMTGGTGQMIKGLQVGSIDIAVLLTEGITKSILEGLDSKIVATYVKSPLKWGIHVPVDAEDIEIPEDIRGEKFAISREGSGSHLMAFVNALNRGWSLQELEFEVVGDIYGGLWALESHTAGVFLWEKFTTKPFVDTGKCKRIGIVETPWPCFVVAVRNEVLLGNEEIINKILSIVFGVAREIKDDPNSANEISWRYNIEPDDAGEWLSETDWNYEGGIREEDFTKAVEFTKTISGSGVSTDGWKNKLFS